MASFLFQRVISLFLIAGCALFSTLSLAELRVIVEYDSAEHRLQRVVELPSSPAAPISDHLKAKANAKPVVANAASKVKLMWFSADGVLLSTDFMNDPRLTHVPLTGIDQSATVVGLDAGAFMVSGPTQSAALEIHMPVNVLLGLDKQVWLLSLDR